MTREEIWKYLRVSGIPSVGVAAVMGNIQAESNFQSDNVEDRAPYTDLQYTSAVDAGSFTRSQFAYDTYGYGLCQWTFYSRKMGLYDLCKQRNVSIMDARTQLDFMLKELDDPLIKHVKAALYGDDLRAATRLFMCIYENPADKSERAISVRVAYAKGLYNQFHDIESSVRPSFYWPPRGSVGGLTDPGLCYGLVGPDVSFLQARLQCAGFTDCQITGEFLDETRTTLCLFQKENGLASDGICGPLTWCKLLEV